MTCEDLSTLTCRQCKQEKPSFLFFPRERVCVPCKFPVDNHGQMKKCSKCRQMKYSYQFYRIKKTNSLTAHCKECQLKKVKKYKANLWKPDQ